MSSDVDKVLGEVEFASDVRVRGMLHCRVVRSMLPHARLVAVDTSVANVMPGVRAIVTGEDLRAAAPLDLRFGPVIHDQPILALDKVRYIGEPVAAVVAETPDEAEEAAAAVNVEYAELPAVFTVDEAIAPGAPRLFEFDPELDPGFADVSVASDFERNVCSTFRVIRGDVRRALQEADEVFEDTFSTPAVQHVPLETHACVAVWRADRLTVYSGTQTPFILRSQLARIFGLPHASVRVIVPAIGGGFGAKTYATIEPLVAALAYVARRPVRLHLSRQEEFVTVTKHAMQVTLRTGVTRHGLILGREATGHYNAGAYAGISPRKIIFGAYGINGPYNVPSVQHEMYAVCTNTPPAGAYRGFGINQAAWAYETQMDMIAFSLGLDPLDLRERNLLQSGDRFCTGESVGSAHFADLLSRVATSVGYRHRTRPAETGDVARGIGLSCIIEGTITPSTSTALVKLNGDGSVVIMTASVEMGQGIQHALRRIAATALGVPLAWVSFAEIDTDVTPYDQQTTASRSVFSMGRALEAACSDISEQLAAVGRHILGDDGEISVQDGRVYGCEQPDRMLTFAEVLTRSGLGNLLGRGSFRTEGGLDPETGQGIASAQWHQAAAAAEVEVDRRTGHVRVVAYRGAVHAGRVIDQVGAQLQCEGGLSFGLGNALFEDLIFDNGQIVNGTLADYMIPALADMPERFSYDIVEGTHEEDSEPHGLGEPPLPPVAPAIGNAIFDAVGVRLRDLPLSAEKVLRALKDQNHDVAARHAAQPDVAEVPT
jgi:CO/xanthine dehydrogenase Mo-binding subunit